MSNSMESIEPYKLAKRQQTLHGSMPVADMPRVRDLLALDQGEVKYSLGFTQDLDGRCVISGHLLADLAMYCQRCMQMFWRKIDSSFTVSPVLNDEAAKLLPDEYEPVTIVEGRLVLPELLEDELILAMPIVAMHEIEECKPLVKALAGMTGTGKTGKSVEKAQDLVHPFQVLQDLKLKKKAEQAEDKNGGTTES